MSDTATRPAEPGLMELTHSRSFPEKSGTLTVTIYDTGHFADAMNFAMKHNISQQFWDAFARLMISAIGPTIARRASVHGEGDNRMEFPERLARDGTMKITPYDLGMPSFNFVTEYEGKLGTVGGMIHHRDSMAWGIHT
jgi:hypothetical protein